MESLQSLPPSAYQKISGKERSETPAAVNVYQPILDRESSSSPVQIPIKDRPVKQVPAWPFQRFASPDTYEAQASVNMRAFLANNLNPLNEPSVIPWLTQEEVETLTQSSEGKGLLMLANDIYQLAQICTAKNKFKITEHSPFEFHVNPCHFLKNIRNFKTQLLTQASIQLLYVPSLSLDNPSDHNLDNIDIISHERLLVKVLIYQVENDQNKSPDPYSLRMDFMRVLEYGSGHNDLLNVDSKAFGNWVDMQLALKRLQLSNIHHINRKFSTGINSFVWSFFKDGIISTNQIEDNQQQIHDYISLFFISNQVLPLFFQAPITDDLKLTGIPALPYSSTQKTKISTLFPRAMAADLLTFGEEFEFCLGGESEICTRQQKELSKKMADKILSKWDNILKTALDDKSITDFKIDPSYKDHFLQSLDIRIGNWYYRIYDDDNLLEVNTSPYTLDQYFTVQGKAMKSYQLFDLFVFDIANALHLSTLSGHKHIGIDKAFHGNSEILLRLLLDVEKRGWFPRLFRREQQSDKWFLYMSRYNESEVFILSAIVEAFNIQLQINPDRKTNESFDSIKQLVETLNSMHLWHMRHIPLNLRHLSGNTSDKEDNRVRKAYTTIEFRFPQAARSGKEAELLNKMLVAWLQLMEKHQHSNTPLEMVLDNPIDYVSGRDDEVTSLFHNFILDLGLNWDTFRTCSFL